MQGRDHAQLTNFLETNGNVAFIPTTNLSQSTQHFQELFKQQNNIRILTPTSEDFFEQSAMNYWLKPQISYIVLINNNLTDSINSAMLHINQNLKNFNAQRFELHNPTTQTPLNQETTQYPTATPFEKTKITDTTGSGIIACIQNLYSEWISPYSHHIALGTLLCIIAYLYGKKS